MCLQVCLNSPVPTEKVEVTRRLECKQKFRNWAILSSFSNELLQLCRGALIGTAERGWKGVQVKSEEEEELFYVLWEEIQ